MQLSIMKGNMENIKYLPNCEKVMEVKPVAGGFLYKQRLIDQYNCGYYSDDIKFAKILYSKIPEIDLHEEIKKAVEKIKAEKLQTETQLSLVYEKLKEGIQNQEESQEKIKKAADLNFEFKEDLDKLRNEKDKLELKNISITEERNGLQRIVDKVLEAINSNDDDEDEWD